MAVMYTPIKDKIVTDMTQMQIATPGRSIQSITALVADQVARSSISSGLCNIFLHHTSASLLLCENADPTVRQDLEAFFGRLVPDGDRLFRHTAEGPDDMPAHVRTVLTQNSISIPIRNGRLALGTWQGLFLWEHRTAPHRRNITLTIIGD